MPKFVSFNPGPSQVYDEIVADFKRAVEEHILSLSHRSEEFQEIFSRAVDGIRTYFSLPTDYRIYFVSSATECMEIVLRGCCQYRSFHFVNGAFARKFFTYAQQMKKNPAQIVAEDGRGFDFGRFEILPDCDLVFLTQNETSTGVRLPYESIEKVRRAYPEKIIAVDIVSSAVSERVPFEMTDCWFFSVQKGCALPAGLGVLIVSGRALEKARSLAKQGREVGSYHSLLTLEDFAQRHQTPATPNVLAIYLLGKVFERLVKKGIEKVERETIQKAKMLYNWLNGHPSLRPFVPNPADRSLTVATIVLPKNWTSKSLQERLAPKNMAVGSGYGKYKETQIRIANFPQHTEDDLKRVQKAVDQVLPVRPTVKTTR